MSIALIAFQRGIIFHMHVVAEMLHLGRVVLAGLARFCRFELKIIQVLFREFYIYRGI